MHNTTFGRPSNKAANQQTTAHPVSLSCSRYFINWLQNENISLAVSTYQTNRLFLFGHKEKNRLSAFERAFDHPMGMAIDGNKLLLATRFQLWQLEDVLRNTNPQTTAVDSHLPGSPAERSDASGQSPQATGELTLHNGYDRLYIPRKSHITGDLDIHELGIDVQGHPIFVNSLYSCLSTISEHHSFTPVWQPKFITQLVPEDRCHLNGLAMQDGEAKFVSSISRSDVAAGWRKQREASGCIIDVPSNELVSHSLSMPHSPRLYQGKLWVLQSGTGELGTIDLATGAFLPVAFCPGYLRGLSFYKNYAIIGLSKIRNEKMFADLALDDRLREKDCQATCGVWVIDIHTGATLHWLEFEGTVTELFDVKVLAHTKRPMALGFRSDEICRTITFEQDHTTHYHGLTGPTSKTASSADRTSGESPVAPDIQYQIKQNFLLQDLTGHYAKLTFPPIALQLESQSPRGPLCAVIALHQAHTVGLIVGEYHIATNTIQILSWYVIPKFRKSGIGSTLLSRLEQIRDINKNVRLRVSYRSSWPNTPGIETILNNQAWSLPRTWMLLCRGNMELIAKAKWVQRVILPRQYEIFSWSDLSKTDRDSIIARQQQCEWFPATLTPFQEESRIEYLNSVGLRLDGEVVGWMITHRINEDTIQYTTLFVRKDLQPLGRALALLVTAIQKQMQSPVFKGQCQVEVQSKAMLRYVKKRLMPYLSSSEEIQYAEK